MNKCTVCICDDELSIRSQLRKYILRYSFSNDIEIDIIELSSIEELFEHPPEYDISKLKRTVAYMKIVRDSQSELIRADRIMYIYSKQRKRRIVCTNDEIISTWQSLDELMAGAPEGKFAFSHKSYIVNLDMVDSVRIGEITISKGNKLPLSTHFKDSFMKALLKNTDI